MIGTRYPAVLRYVSETPWAMLPSTLLALREIISRRAAGFRLTDEELAKVAAAAPKRNAVQSAGGSVAVIPLWGVLSPHQVSDISSGPTTALDGWAATFDAAVNDPDVSAIVLDIDSPGGAVDLVPETAAKIRAATGRKPVVAVANTRAASAAYWLASQASELVVSPSGAVGSVGVYAAHEDISRQLDAEGVTVTLISAGDNKTDGNPFEPLTDQARATIQANVDAYYRMFTADVARGRGVDGPVVTETFGQGKMLLAADAVRVGMADRVGTLEQTVAGLLGGKPAQTRKRAAALEPALAAGDIVPAYRSITIDLAGLARATGPQVAAALRPLLLAATHEEPAAADAPPDKEAAGPAGGVVPIHHTPVIDTPWDGPGQVAKLASPVTKARGFGMFAWYDPDGNDPDGDGYPDAKADWKFEHHQVGGDGNPHDAVVSGCRNGLARLSQADIPEADRAGVKAHLQAHIDDFNKNSGGASASAASAAPGGDTKGAASSVTAIRKEHTVDYTSIEELVARREEITQRMTELDSEATGRALDDVEQAEFDDLGAELGKVDEAVANINARRQTLADIAGTKPESNIRGVVIRKPGRGGIHTNVDSKLPEDIFNLGSYRSAARSVEELAGLHRDGARRVNELLRFETPDTDRAHNHVERVLLSDDEGSFARRMIITGSAQYERAFAKMVARGRDGLTSQEDSLIKAAISETGLSSETPVPVTIDPTVMLTSDGATNPLRAVADVRTITGKSWRGISSDGVTVTYEAELNQVADQTPAFAAPDIDVIRAQGYVEFSNELDEDWGSLRTNLATAFTDAKDVKEGSIFFTGSGSGEPEGLLTALTASTIVGIVQKTASSATFAATDPKTASNALPVRWDANAQWFASKSIWADLEDLLAALGNSDPFSFAANAIPNRPSGNTGRVYRGYPMNAASAMSAVTTTGANLMIIGDPRAFVIVDRIGMNVELIPVVMGANQRPKGARALYVYWRNTSAVRTVKAFRVLQSK